MSTYKQPNKWNLLREIFWTFFKIGPITFGGGYAMIPLIEKEIVEKKQWMQSKDIANLFAISGSIPGAIAINSATFVGFRIAGIPGAIAAMAGVLLPTFSIVILLCSAFLYVKDSPKIEAAFHGIRATTVALIVFAGIKIGRTAIFDKTTLAIAIATVSFMLLVPINPLLVISAGAILGILFILIKERHGLAVMLEKEETTTYIYSDYYMGDGI